MICWVFSALVWVIFGCSPCSLLHSRSATPPAHASEFLASAFCLRRPNCIILPLSLGPPPTRFTSLLINPSYPASPSYISHHHPSYSSSAPAPTHFPDLSHVPSLIARMPVPPLLFVFVLPGLDCIVTLHRPVFPFSSSPFFL